MSDFAKDTNVPTNDCISRQAAIDAICKACANGDDFTECRDRELKTSWCDNMVALRDLPSAQPTEASCWGCNCTKMERLKEQKTFSEMVHLHDAETHDKRTETHGVCLDTISRQAAIDGILAFMPVEFGKDASMAEQVNYSAWRTAISCAESYVRTMPPAQLEDKCGECDAWNQYKNYPRQRWIPVKFRSMDSEEREYWEGQFGEELADEDAVVFDCPMPEDGQEILVSYRKWISVDRCEVDCGCYGLEGNGDWEDVIAWMPLPEPYAERRTDEKADIR